MMKRFTLFFAQCLLFVIPAFTQTISISPAEPVSFCQGDSVLLSAQITGSGYGTNSYSFQVVPYHVEDYVGDTCVDPDFGGNTDDSWAGPYPIGFQFCFLNQIYTQYWICTNGWIGFSNPAGHSWTTYTPFTLPSTNPNVPKNAIFAPYQDWYVHYSGNGHSGTNTVFRHIISDPTDSRLVVQWEACYFYDCYTGGGIQGPPTGTFQIVLHQQNSIIENNITLKGSCSWQGNAATQGVHNIDGTMAYIAFNRNQTSWTTSNESTRFVPSGVSWYSGAYPGGTLVGQGDSIEVKPNVTTTYFAVVNTCLNGSAVSSKTVTVFQNPVPFINGNTNVCFNNTEKYTTLPHMGFYGWTVQNGTIVSGGTPTADSVVVHWNIATGPYSVTINCTDTNGCSARTPFNLNVTVNPFTTPVITGTNSICAGAQTTYTTQTGYSNYIWTYPGATLISGGTINDNTITLSWAIPNNYTISVNYTGPGGCTANPAVTKSVLVNGIPVPTYAGPAVSCLGLTQMYSTVGGMTGYNWSVSPGGTITSGQNTSTVSVTWNALGSQTLWVTYTDIKGCTNNNPPRDSINVITLPIPTITGNNSICKGSTGNSYSTETGMSGYFWSVMPDGTITSGAGTNNIQCTWGTTGTKVISVNYINTGGCTAVTASTDTVIVHGVPSPTITGTNNVCKGTTGLVYTTQTGMSNYVWNVSAGGTITAGGTAADNTVTVTWNTPGAQTVSVDYADVNLCTATAPIVYPVTVNALPGATISGTTAVCQFSPGPLVTFTGSGTTPPYTFTYNIDGGANQVITTVAGNSVTLPAPTNVIGTFTYNLVSVQDGSAITCSQPQAGSAVITVNPLPTATIAGTTAVCQNAASPLITFTGAATTPPYTFTYNINGGGNQIVTTTVGNSVTVAAPTNISGTFTYNLISVQDGSATTCSQLQPGSAVITVNPSPTATITGTIAVCQNAAAPLVTFSGGAGTAPYTFTYNINGGANQQVTTIIGNNVTVAAPTNTTGVFTYNLVSVQDASSTTCSQPQAGSAVVTVNPLPTATIAGTIAVCQNTPSPLITFTGASGSSPYTFTYNINGGGNQIVTTVVGNSITVAAPTNVVGTFTYNLVSIMDGSSTACTQPQAGNAVITVNPLPTAMITGSTAVCQNSTAPVVTFTGAAATAPYTFTYNINGGANLQVTTTVGNSVTVTAPTNIVGIFTYNLVSVQDASTTTCQQPQSGSAIITVNPLPTATISGTTAICKNAASPLITFTGASATAPYTFTYNINGGANQQVTTTVGNSVTVAAPTNILGTFSYNLISVQDASITTCSQPQAGSAVVTVTPLPTAMITGSTDVCQNAASPLITFTGAAATAPYTFTYNINGGANQQVTTLVGNSVTVAAPTNIVGGYSYNLVSVQEGSATACSQPQAGSAVITVNPLPTALISGSTAVCQNSASPLITFTGASSTAPYTFTYNINGGANLFVTTTIGNSVTVSAPTNIVGVFTYNLVSVQDGSLTTCSQSQAGSATVTVNPLPTATIAGSIAVCKNAPSPLITFTGASGTAPYTFTYNINGGGNQVISTVIGNSVTVDAPTNVTGTFTYNLASVQDGSSTTCSQPQAGSATVTVNQLPTAIISGTTAVCQDAVSPLITFTGATTTPPYTFTYNIDGGATQQVTTVVGNSVTIAAPTNTVGSFTYNLISVQDGSPTTCSQAQAGSAVITVNPLPTATISGSTAVCKNSASPLITFTGASATAPYTFTYNINGGGNQFITTTVGNSVTIAAPTNVVGSFTYNLVSVQDGSFTSCSQPQAGSATITVNPLPTAVISGTTAVCQNSPSPLITFTGASASAPYTFTYSINGGPNQFVTTAVGNSVTVSAPTNNVGSFTYSLISVQDGSSTTCIQPQAGTAVVTVNPLPTATIIGSTAVCQNAASPPITFTGASSTGPYTFTYNINGGANQFVTTSVGNSVTVAAPTSIVGVFTYNLVSVSDGSTTLCNQPQTGSAVITIEALPVPTVLGPVSVCLNSTSTYATESGMTSYSWTVSAGGTITGGATTNTITVLWSATGNKTITVNYFNATNCTATVPTVYTVNVSNLPSPTLTGTSNLCVGNSEIYTTDAGMSGYAWVVSAGGTITAGGGPNDNTATVTWNTVGSQTISINYQVGPGCLAPSPVILPITVKPRPFVTNALPFSVCSATTIDIIPQADLGGTTFSWTASGSSGNVTGFVSGGGTAITDNLINSGSNIETVTYAVLPSLNGCDGAVSNFVVTVFPVAHDIFTPNGQTFCSGGTTSIGLSSLVTGVTFTWTATPSSGNVNGFGPGSGNTIAQLLNNTGFINETVTYHVLPTANGCPGINNDVTVTVAPIPQVVFTPCTDIITSVDAKPITLKGGIPLGGTYSGTGVNAGIFYQSLAGAGTHSILYSYTTANSCSSNASLNITVVPASGFACSDLLTDIRDNAQYPTIGIGTQCWMAANLNYGNFVPSTTVQRDNCIIEKYCMSDNAVNCTSMGGLYQWDEIMQYNTLSGVQGLCPPAWHVPTEAEWTMLFNYFISNGFAGNPLKASGYSGFNAILLGVDFNYANMDFGGFATYFWSSTSSGTNKAWAHALNSFNPSVSYYPSARSNNFSVRCIKD
jgi:uncharacterized protein (TIGR02145 family)